MTIRDEAARIVADRVMREFALTPTPFWSRYDMLALVREIERLRRAQTMRPTPALTFWLGADAPCAP